MKLPRSKLFIPGNRPERMRKAAELRDIFVSLCEPIYESGFAATLITRAQSLWACA